MRKIGNFLLIVVYGIVIWTIITCTVQRFKCVKLTETELFLKIPHSFICEWEPCK